ncbi:MAG TPA: hypothetical protein VK948_02585 [Aeromicrobium sp.]|nr:hypothetical protein [Aeromicrobium sp.]
MQESDFDVDHTSVDDCSRRFPAHRLTRPSGQPDADVSYLRTSPGAEFRRHAWDEGGHS